MVFLNMGGPSKIADVEDFLSRLFVRRKHACLFQGTLALTASQI